MEHSSEVITWVFLIANAGRIFAYVPQLIAAWNCKNGASSVSRLTWGYFAFAHLSGVLYGACVIHDAKMAWMFLGNLFVCIALVCIVTWKKKSHVQASFISQSLSSVPVESPWGEAI